MKKPIILPILIITIAAATLAACSSAPKHAKRTPNDDRPFSAQTGQFEEHRPGNAQGAHADAHR